MKRALVVLVVLALAVFVALTGTAGANNVPVDEVTISCTEVAFDWTQFPARPVDLSVAVDFLDQDVTETVSTGGATSGAGSLPLALEGSGLASVTVSWTLGETDHQSGPVFAELECETATTTTEPPATTPSSESPDTTPTSVVSGPPSDAECGPGTLACTGASGAGMLMLAGWLIVALGLSVWFGARVRRGER